MLIRWGQISLVALLAVVAFFIAGDVRDVASQDRSADAGADEPPEGILEAGGQVESVVSIGLRCEVPGVSTIREIVPDGTTVSEGDVIVQLDDSSLRIELARKQVEAARARAEVEQAESRLMSRNATAGGSRRLIELRLEIAELELRRYREAELPLQIRRLDSRIETAEEMVEALNQQTERLESVIEELPGARDELDAVRVELTEARGALDLARSELEVLLEFDGPLTTKRFELEVAEARLALDEATQNGMASRAEGEAALAASQLAVDDIERQVTAMEASLEKCAIRAPRDGVVLHTVATFRRSTSNTLAAGSEVREGQPLVHVSDLSQLMVRLAVDEEQLGSVKVGQSVSLSFGDFEDRMTGTVRAIGERQLTQAFPQGSRTNQPPRSVLVEFDEQPTGVRIGTLVRAAIDVSSAGDAED